MSRLEEIKSILSERKNYKDDMHFVIDTEAYEYLILSLEDGKHIDWLVRQVERAERLKEENAGLHDILAQIEYQEKDKLLAENNRYREAIKGAIGKFNYDYHQEGMAELLNVLEESE